jgi:hypothetical protein
VPTSVETTFARGLDLTPEKLSKPDLKQVGLFFFAAIGVGLSGRAPAVHRARLADALRRRNFSEVGQRKQG